MYIVCGDSTYNLIAVPDYPIKTIHYQPADNEKIKKK